MASLGYALSLVLGEGNLRYPTITENRALEATNVKRNKYLVCVNRPSLWLYNPRP